MHPGWLNPHLLTNHCLFLARSYTLSIKAQYVPNDNILLLFAYVSCSLEFLIEIRNLREYSKTLLAVRPLVFSFVTSRQVSNLDKIPLIR